MSKKKPWRIRLHLWLYGHVLTHYNDTITVPAWEPNPYAMGILADCSCGKRWAI